MYFWIENVEIVVISRCLGKHQTLTPNLCHDLIPTASMIPIWDISGYSKKARETTHVPSDTVCEWHTGFAGLAEGECTIRPALANRTAVGSWRKAGQQVNGKVYDSTIISYLIGHTRTPTTRYMLLGRGWYLSEHLIDAHYR
jgi:hypothetical protein